MGGKASSVRAFARGVYLPEVAAALVLAAYPAYRLCEWRVQQQVAAQLESQGAMVEVAIDCQVWGVPLTEPRFALCFAGASPDFVTASRLGNVEALVIDGAIVDAEAARGLGDMTGVKEVYVYDVRADARFWQELGKLKTVASLDVVDTHVRPAGFAPIGRLSSLIMLSLENTGLTDEGMAHVGKLSQVFELHIDGAVLTGQGLRQLAGLTELETLYLVRCGLSDGDLTALPPLPKLQYLHLGGNPIGDAALETLSRYKAESRLASLDGLGVPFTNVTDAGLANLKRMGDLTALDLRGTKVTDAGLRSLESLPLLSRLSLSKTNVTPAGLARLEAFLPKLSVWDRDALFDEWKSRRAGR